MPKAARIVKPDPAVHSASEPQPLSPLARELRKRRPFESTEQEIFLNLLRTVSVLTDDFVPVFKRHGLSESTYNALRILRGAGTQGKSCSQIAADTVARVPDITRIVDRLEAMGYAQRSRVSSDRRVVMVTITQRGLDLLSQLDEPVSKVHKDQLGHLSRAEQTQLNELLVKARRAPWRTTADQA
ncbi:MAG: MarR family transcriptional regulator [Phycisphaerales bacterium]|nr:MarR family transcriptional regulator [Phycisphaerales bacterium]